MVKETVIRSFEQSKKVKLVRIIGSAEGYIVDEVRSVREIHT